MTEPVEPVVTLEAVGETVGEAKWAALRELERRYPGLSRDDVDFQVLSEGERGLMGVGREPARVMARLMRVSGAPAPARPAPPSGPRRTPSRPARRPEARPRPSGGGLVVDDGAGPAGRRAGEIVAAICSGIGLPADVRVTGSPQDGLLATVLGDDLGLLIGRRGHTIDAVQYLVNALIHHGNEERVSVTVDAQNYRRRREASLRDAADRAAEEAVRLSAPVELDEMTSAERKVVHLHLQDHAHVATESAGREPHRYVVVRPRPSS